VAAPGPAGYNCHVAGRSPLPPDESRLIDALRRRDEAAFLALVRRHHASLLRLARVYVGSQAVAEEVAQDAWLGVLQGIDRFEARSSFKTWLFRILVNRAKTRGERESRTVPFSALGDGEAGAEPFEPAVDPARFRGPDDAVAPFHWSQPPRPWESPEERLLSAETLGLIAQAIAGLPPRQRAVITLRDVEGLSAEDVCNVLEISDTNQRVLLHRARSHVRAALERHLEPE
jgi:RNA polymerase sigma-70 factor, ECF subfamily